MRLTRISSALANYRHLARYNGIFSPIKYLYFELIGKRKPVQVQYAGHQITVRTCSSDLSVAYWCLEANEFTILKEILATGDVETVIDAGGYVGFSALAIANMFPECKIFAIEPDPDNHALLVLNTRDNPNIIPINAALMAQRGRVALYDPGRDEWGFSAVSDVGAKRAEIRALSIIDLMDEFKLDRIDVLKLDVEGAEKVILENSGDWIASVVVIFAELHDRFAPGASRAYFRATESFEDIIIAGHKVCAINRKPVLRSPEVA